MSVLRIISWNVNGVRACYRKGFMEWLLAESPDILCIQETKAREEQIPDEIKGVEGYYTYWVSAEKKGYSGVGLFTKQKPAGIQKGLGVERLDKEGRILIADYQRFLLLNVYFPNGKASKERLEYKMDFYDAFLDYADRLKDERRDLIICGDVNTAHTEIDLARPKQNEKVSGFLPEERAWIDRFVSHGFVDTFRMFNQQAGHYTWWDLKTRARERDVGWRIDYFFVSDSMRGKVRAASILPDVMGSDHCPVAIEILDERPQDRDWQASVS